MEMLVLLTFHHVFSLSSETFVFLEACVPYLCFMVFLVHLKSIMMYYGFRGNYIAPVRMSTLSRIINKYSCNVRLDILHHNSAILIVLFPVFSNGALCPRLRRHNFPDNLGKKINMYDKLFKVVHRGHVK
jgi:hypothetical protein